MFVDFERDLLCIFLFSDAHIVVIATM